MFRLIIIATIAAAASACGIWAGTTLSSLTARAAEAGEHSNTAVKTEFITPELLVVPLLGGKSFEGFLVARFALAVNAAIPPATDLSEETLIADLYYAATFNGTAYVPGSGAVPDLTGAAANILEKLNERTGAPRYLSIYIQQVDLFDRSEMRQKVVEDRFVPSD